MEDHDVSLLCGPEKVLFGTELLAFVGIDLTDMAGSRYGSLQFLLDQFAAWQNDRRDHEIAS